MGYYGATPMTFFFFNPMGEVEEKNKMADAVSKLAGLIVGHFSTELLVSLY